MIEDDSDVYNQQVQTTDVTINLVDCMKCSVSLMKCEVNILVSCNWINASFFIHVFVKNWLIQDRRRTTVQFRPNYSSSYEQSDKRILRRTRNIRRTTKTIY